MHLTTNCLSLISCLLLGLGGFDSSRPNGRATILYDAFGNSKNLSKDWAFSVLIECAGKQEDSDGAEPRAFSSGSPWPEANFVPVESILEVAPGISLIPTISNVKGTLELRELTLAIYTPSGLVLVVECSHAGVEEILSAASPLNPHVHMLLGGLHLVKIPDAEIDRLASPLHDKWKIDRIDRATARESPPSLS